MAYTPIPNEELEPGKPGSSELFIKLRDNPEGIAAGSPGAPKIQREGINLNAVDVNRIATNQTTWESVTIPENTSVDLPTGFIQGFMLTAGASTQVQLLIDGNWRNLGGKAAGAPALNFSVLVSDALPGRLTNQTGAASLVNYARTI